MNVSVNEKPVTTNISGPTQNSAERGYAPSQLKEPPYHVGNNFIFLLQVGALRRWGFGSRPSGEFIAARGA
jgi:hypothetical protein